MLRFLSLKCEKILRWEKRVSANFGGRGKGGRGGAARSEVSLLDPNVTNGM